LIFCFIFLLIAVSVKSLNERNKAKRKINNKIERMISCPHFVAEWECDYCGKVVRQEKISPRDFEYQRKEAILFFLVNNHLKDCEKGKRLISKINKLKEKKDFAAELKKAKRTGVVKSLKVNGVGKVDDLVIFLTPRTIPVTRQNFHELFKGNSESEFFYSIHGSKEVNSYEKIVVALFIWRVLQKQESWNYNIYLSEADKDFSPLRGNSLTMSLYLSLLSSFYKKPVSQEVAVTGCVETRNSFKLVTTCSRCLNNEVTKRPKKGFSGNRITFVDNLEYKMPAAVKAGVKKLILSTEQKENYEKIVPLEIREQLKVYYVKNVEELEKLFFKGEFS
jgi:hypothetical protein